MKDINCKFCKMNSNIEDAERSLKNIKREIDKLLNIIPNNYRNKNRVNLNVAKQHFHGFCGGHCSNGNDYLFSIKENKIFNDIEKIISFYRDNKDTFKLVTLKESCRGTYSKLYRLIEIEENKKN